MLTHKRALIFVLVMIASLVLSACGGGETPAPTQDVALIQTQAAQTVIAEMTLTAPEPTLTPAPTLPPTQPPSSGPATDSNLPVAVLPAPAEGQPAAQADLNTVILSGPGYDYVVYGAFLGGRTATVVGKSEDGLWWAVSVPVAPGGTGWVEGALVTVSNAGEVPVLPTPPVPESVNLVPPGPDDPQATLVANEYVRSGPAANYPAYGIAEEGASARVIGKSEDGQWLAVRIDPAIVGAGYGWVMAQYAETSNLEGIQTIQSPTAPIVVPHSAPPEGAPAATAVDYINVRSGPGTYYPVLGVAAPGATAEVTGRSPDNLWWQVKLADPNLNGGFGWVSDGYVTTQNADAVPVVQTPPIPPTVGPTPPAASPVACTLEMQSPADGTVYQPGATFNTTWVVKNTGTANWEPATHDILFVGALNNRPLHQGADRYDLTTPVESGWTYDFVLPMIAPADPGVYGELWRVVSPEAVVCEFYVYIEVQ
jgi:uncharacterized protein YraI